MCHIGPEEVDNGLALRQMAASSGTPANPPTLFGNQGQAMIAAAVLRGPAIVFLNCIS